MILKSSLSVLEEHLQYGLIYVALRLFYGGNHCCILDHSYILLGHGCLNSPWL
jgi:hypothetical protein